MRNHSVSKRKHKQLLYALISISRPANKPNSLEFSIEEGYNTEGVKNYSIYNTEIQKEMDSIITVLNRIFDEENTTYYIGNKNKLYSIHNKTNLVLKDINNYSTFVTRRNKGKMMYPPFISNEIINLTYIKRKPIQKGTRKKKIIT